MPPGLAGQFTGACLPPISMWVPFGFQILGGLLMARRALCIARARHLAPILVNILTFHLTMAPGILPGLVCTLLWFVVFAAHRESFRGILSANG